VNRAALSLLLAACASAQTRFVEGPQRVDVYVNGKAFTTFHYEDHWDKPFLHPLRTWSGVEVTRGYPVAPREGETRDHEWHRGLWFGHGDVNGVDFWRELGRGKSGRIVVRGRPKTGGARLEAPCDFVAPGGRRVASGLLAFHFSTDGRVNTIDAAVTLTAEPGGTLRLGDTEDGGFALRYADEFKEERGAILRNSEGLTGTKQIWGKRARWVDYSARRDGVLAGAAILDHPSNPRHPTYWHARGYGVNSANPFGVRDFTGDKTADGSFEVKGSVTFRYRVVLHEGAADPEAWWRDFRSAR